MVVFIRWIMRIAAGIITTAALIAIHFNMPTVSFHVAVWHFLAICCALLLAMALALGSFGLSRRKVSKPTAAQVNDALAGVRAKGKAAQ